MQKKKIVDLFAGCGGLSLGFQNAGFEIIAAFEYWNVAADCYEKNFTHPVFRDDLSDTDRAIDKIKKLSPEIIIGGPPCQDFSHAGKRIEEKRAGLTESYAQIVSNVFPKWFVMENVDRAEKSETYAVARKTLKNAGYGLTEIVLNASRCGTPQKRKRFFCIGSLGTADGYLLDSMANCMSKKETTLRDYFGASLDFEYYYRHPRNYCRRAIYSIDEPSPTIRGVNRPVPAGYRGRPNDACKLNPSIRSLTTLERSLIQTFPADFKWTGNKTDMEQMIGNAVPVKLAEFVAKALWRHIEESEKTTVVDENTLTDWLQKTQPLSEKIKKTELANG
ncbi:MAG: DNA cytosine methyltransferase [Planctomycetaceae bacterium]|nr:DNA cytosine methyltransferase [Planctomycetaceae bacterium]